MIQKSSSAIIVFFLVLFGLSSCKVQNRKVTNQSDLTAKGENKGESEPYITSIKTDYILKDSSSLMLYLEVEFENLLASGLTSIGDFQKKFRTNWVYNPAFGIKEKLESGRMAMTEKNSTLEGNTLSMELELPRLRTVSEVKLVLEFIDLSASRKFTNEAFIDFNAERPNHRFGMFVNGDSRPTFKSYVTTSTPIRFKSVDELARPLFLKRYATKSPPALSPMSTSKRSDFTTFEEKEVIRFYSGDELKLTQEGTYVLLDEEEGLGNGFGFLVVNERYPRLTAAEDLLGPLAYMSTNSEIIDFREADTLKNALDLYFLKMSVGNETLAKQVIKSYYRRVEKTNSLFTSYKEGWKSDKGMIYLILGPPSRIQRTGDREVWLYAQSANFSEIIFTFYRKQNQFSENHYELVRYPEYGAYWYPFVEAWRTGNVLE
ncbi:MAG: GWxTD domain-containing protein [Arcticibacterium sp.]|jgi:GWxTD domain-containing protein